MYFRQWNLNADGVSYFDLARAFAAHGPRALVNGYWSPLYPALLGTVLAALRPSHDAAYPVIRAVGFGVFVLTTFAFARLVRTALSVPNAPPNHVARLLAVVVAWELYAVLVLKGIGLPRATPDAGVAAVFFWAGAELITVSRRPMAPARWMRLGAVLAVGYWWKAILFPVSGVVLIVAAAVALRRRDDWHGPAGAFATFGALALLLIIPVSRHTGRLTFGETGRLNQMWFVSQAAQIVETCPAVRPAVAPRGGVQLDTVIANTPLTCALPDRWPESTLPLWYDPSQWYRNASARLDLRATRDAVVRDLGYVRDALGETSPWLTVMFCAAALLVLLARAPGGGAWPLAIVAAGSVGFYLLVYVELRHIVPFLVAAGLVVLAALVTRVARWRVIALTVLAAGGAVDLVNQVGEPVLIEGSILRHEFRGDARPAQRSARVAHALAQRGLMEGDRLATVNGMLEADWAQRGGFVVRAYTPDYTVSFLRTFRELRDACTRAAWAKRLAAARIDAAVMLVPDGFKAPDGFEGLEDTGYYILRVDRQKMPDGCPAA